MTLNEYNNHYEGVHLFFEHLMKSKLSGEAKTEIMAILNEQFIWPKTSARVFTNPATYEAKGGAL